MAENIGMLRLRVDQLVSAICADNEQRVNALRLVGLIFKDYPDTPLVKELKKRGQVI